MAEDESVNEVVKQSRRQWKENQNAAENKLKGRQIEKYHPSTKTDWMTAN